MTAPNMATITASLERSLQNCSLNHSSSSHGGGEGSGHVLEDGLGLGLGISSTDDDASPENLSGSDTTLELNSQISLPYHWEQCLDLKTGEIYYINWRNGMKAKEDPRTMADYSAAAAAGDGEEEELYYPEDDGDSSCDSEGSSSESPPSSSRNQHHHHPNHHYRAAEKDQVLVVAGCKSCLMYFMVPKQVEDCPKCAGQLLHFDRSEPANDASP